MLELQGIRAGYGGVEIIRDVTLSVNEGRVVSLLGANGAGKSTLLSVVSGLMRPWAGMVRFMGTSITGWRPDQVAEEGLIQVPQGRRLFTKLSVMDNLLLGNTPRRARPMRKELLQKVFSMFPILDQRREQLAGTLSGGQQQMVAIGRALMSNPELLLCDELSLGLAPVVIREIYDAMPAITGEGMAVVIVEQDISMAQKVSQHLYCLQEGRISLSGESATLSREAIGNAYFGV